ncbi:VanZ family protein [Wenzhouxiangella sp. EGI_FJ10305]|uniref:VanZ family protein n=1 Tax=Wenzhouxiangella sp. EGI_FJ10305 TaxID=3243768 RepID=UPI0035DE6767
MKGEPPRKSNPASHARWAVAVAAILAILLGSLLPGGTLVVPIDIEPPTKHLLAYGLLGALLVLATGAGWLKALLLAAILALAGVLIEILQLFIPDRSFLWIDILTGCLGALAGVVLGRFIQWFVR